MTAFIFGVSCGLGNELVQAFLHAGKNVLGIGRHIVIRHHNYSFIQCDHSFPCDFKNTTFEAAHEECELINIAGLKKCDKDTAFILFI
jgi:hypothetical protein